MTIKTSYSDVCIIGTGLAGVTTALACADQGLGVMLVYPDHEKDISSSYWAQGGIAAFTEMSKAQEADSLELHVQDTYVAGAFHGDLDAIRCILQNGNSAIQWCRTQGVHFDTHANGTLHLTREGAHSVPRILHVMGDQTGRGMMMPLIKRLQAHPHIQCVAGYALVDLLQAEFGSSVQGCALWNGATNQRLVCRTPHVVLATGGYANLFENTTNPMTSASASVFKLAVDAGCTLKDMHLVQFHPTAFYYEGQVRFLVSEALRGEGAILQNKRGESFASRYHPQGELAPRDIVARAIYTEMQTHASNCVGLDLSGLEPSHLQHRFPFICSQSFFYGVDPFREPLPVAPAAHYTMGGIQATPYGDTGVEGLYAIGEASCTGLHGANRLASNSLLECVVMGLNAADAIASKQVDSVENNRRKMLEASTMLIEESTLSIEEAQRFEAWKQRLRHTMWRYLGIVRTGQGLETMKQHLITLADEAINFEPGVYKSRAEALHFVATECHYHAVHAPCNVGAHYREDFATTVTTP